MNDHAYDISHLLESDPIQVAPRIVSAPRAVPDKPRPISLAEAQEAMARELMQAASLHDALVEQFLRMQGDASRDSYSQ